MKIKGLNFQVNAASGSLSWFGDGYWYHEIYKRLIPGYKQTIERISFVAKTTTLNYNAGNLPWKKNFQPKGLFAACIKIYFLLGLMLNAVGLSGPGFRTLLATGRWQKINRPFGISFSAISKTLDGMIMEAMNFVGIILEARKAGWRFPDWVQVNDSCPNIQHLDDELAIIKLLEVFTPLKREGIVIDLKTNIKMKNSVIKEIEIRHLCNILTVSNTLKWGDPDVGINWEKLLWWRKTSPLAKFGGGAVSGRVLRPLVFAKVKSIRHDGIDLPLKVSGGIFTKKDVRTVKEIGGNAIEISAIFSVRPWRLRGVVKEAEKLF